MKVTRYLKEEISLIVGSIGYLFFFTDLPVRETSFHFITLFFVFSLFELTTAKRYRLIYYFLFLLSLFFQFFHPIYLVLLTYFLTRDFRKFGLLVVPFVWLISAPHFLYYFFVLGAYYLAQSSVQLEEQIEHYYQAVDQLNEEKIKAKNHQNQIFQAKQNELQMAILEERNRISHQLHDAVGHSLARSIMQIEAMKTLPQSNQMNQQLDTLQGSLKTGMNDIRKTIHEIHQESLNLTASIQELQMTFPDLTILYQENLDSSLIYTFKVDLLTIIRETIHNSIKHSDATEIQIVLQEYAGILKLMLKDNGTDFNSKYAIQDGIGQTMIRQIGQKYQAAVIIRYTNGYLTQLIFDKKHLKNELI